MAWLLLAVGCWVFVGCADGDGAAPIGRESAATILAELRAISDDARAGRVEPFRQGAERMFAAPRRLSIALRAVRTGGVPARDMEAVAECAAAAITSYAESRTSGYWGPDLDCEAFFDQVVETLPSFSPTLAEALLDRLIRADALAERHTWMCEALARLEGTRSGAWEALEHLHARGWAADETLLSFAESTGESELDRSIRNRAWCALVRSAPAAHVSDAMKALAVTPAWTHEREVLATCIAERVDPSKAFELLRDLLPTAPVVTSEGIRLFERFDSTELASLAMEAFMRESVPTRRCYWLAMARAERSFVESAAQSDPSPLVRAWATYYAFVVPGEACERICVVLELVQDLGRGSARGDENACVDRVLEVLRLAEQDGVSCALVPDQAWIDGLALLEAAGRGLSEGRRERLRERVSRFRERIRSSDAALEVRR